MSCVVIFKTQQLLLIFVIMKATSSNFHGLKGMKMTSNV